MLRIEPIKKALIPMDNRAAIEVNAQNYDEFQGNDEIYSILQEKPRSILSVTMSHCAVDLSARDYIEEDSQESLELAGVNFKKLIDEGYLVEIEDAILIYDIEDPRLEHGHMTGLVCMACTDQIRTDTNPGGVIIRNEGIYEKKARNRADMAQAINADIGIVNNGIQDSDNKIQLALSEYTGSTDCDFNVPDESGRPHRVWVIRDDATINRFKTLFSKEKQAYVADGNHRSAAAALLGKKEFLSIFFPVRSMALAPYNRLLKGADISNDKILTEISKSFTVEKLELDVYEPEKVFSVGWYDGDSWYKLVPRENAYDPEDAVQMIDADIVHRKIIIDIMGIEQKIDPRINYVGGNKDGAYLKSQVDTGKYGYAITFAPVSIDQFIAVCEQNRFMPPKSTWFDPKVRSGLVIARYL
jgi:uncharacterized protein (DUF1015 family)